MKQEDKRFQMGWAAVALMFGVALLVNYFREGDIYIVVSVFFVGLALILAGLSMGVGTQNKYLLGFAGILGLIGVVALALRPVWPIVDIGLLLGGIIAGAALAFMVYTFARK
ncbi:MAG: hypothetical protein D5R99_00205 [Methanocalculus sp. MSAO_Arc1]|uniref:hypothetical protein n=1 Tax=Methanocalculus TaxID=71151 RepID=UPI000FF53115|nr:MULTISPECIES: hypothetical protein [unclassified Methanocalculus]MCP1662867.1 uncharacterized membrane protein HdeD (DUF308 family) [Methanocalculus sp. AMF5]RQD82077.1 MAG: hypothetical protein D5R99_00205 [Methanocalculus sp. MSAO_Arc1]